MSSIPCLSVRQPWAWAIVHGYKPLENRTWMTGFKGRLLIHAGQTWGKAENADLEKLRIQFPQIPWPKEYDLGGIVGEVRMQACVPAADGETLAAGDAAWWNGGNGFIFREPKVLPFTPMKGLQGFFAVPATVLENPGQPAPRPKYVPDDRGEKLL